MKTATVIGLGNMGFTLARLLLRAGYRVTVWNRSPNKAEALAAEGAHLAQSPAEAVKASPLVIVCVLDYVASQAILARPEVEAALAGRAVVQFTTGSPRDARESEGWAHRHGAAYLDGAIQAAPAEMGLPDTAILVSGAKSTFDAVEATLRIFGGGLTYLGEAIGAASSMDLATLSYVYGASLGFIHGARVAETEGFKVGEYGAIIEKIAPAFGAFLKHEANVIQSGDFRVTASPMSISIAATERMLTTAREAGLNDEIPAFFADFLQRAKAAGYENEEAAALIKLLRGTNMSPGARSSSASDSPALAG
jgi:3-hydroxyisobutyrate dehydrogenase-like beta-hydroxyacid dehydrogenase